MVQATGHRDGERTCHEASRRNTDNDLSSEQPASETLMAKISTHRPPADAAVTAASSAPQEVKFASTVNSPVRLAASDESGENSVSLKMLGDSTCCHPGQDKERSATQ